MPFEAFTTPESTTTSTLQVSKLLIGKDQKLMVLADLLMLHQEVIKVEKDITSSNRPAAKFLVTNFMRVALFNRKDLETGGVTVSGY